LNRPRDSQPDIEKVLDSTAKSKSSCHFLEGEKGPKMAEKDPDNPEKPDRVRSAKKKPQER
jgi:hypothetical protein